MAIRETSDFSLKNVLRKNTLCIHEIYIDQKKDEVVVNFM